jgi:hypothetical protein
MTGRIKDRQRYAIDREKISESPVPSTIAVTFPLEELPLKVFDVLTRRVISIYMAILHPF